MSNNLGRTTVAAAQGSDVFVAINDADEVMDKALTGVFDLNVDGTTATLTAAEWKHQTIRIGDDSPGATGVVTVTVPNTVRGLVTIINNLAFDVTIEISGQPLAGPTIPAGAPAVVHSDGVNVRLPGTGSTYDVSLSFVSAPSANEIIGAYVFVRDVTFPADFAAARGWVGSPPAATFVISVRDDGVEIGTITISNDSPQGIFTFETVGNQAVTVAAGSLFEFVAPAAPDAAINYIIAMLAGSA